MRNDCVAPATSGPAPRRCRRRVGRPPHGVHRLRWRGRHPRAVQRTTRADDRRPRLRIREGDGHPRRGSKSNDEDYLAEEIAGARSHSPADVFFTENSQPLEHSRGSRLARPGRRLDPRKDAGQVRLARGGVGRGDGSRERPRLQPEAHREEPVAHPRSAARRSAVQGKARHRARRDGLPADRHLGRACLWPSCGAQMAAGHQGERRRAQLPRQRDDHRRGQPWRSRVRHHQPVLLVPVGGTDRNLEPDLEDRLFRPWRPRLCRRRVGRSRPRLEQASGGRAEVPRSSSRPPRARRSSPTRRASSTRSHPA